MWQYGDITPDDAREFGVGRRPGTTPAGAKNAPAGASAASAKGGK